MVLFINTDPNEVKITSGLNTFLNTSSTILSYEKKGELFKEKHLGASKINILGEKTWVITFVFIWLNKLCKALQIEMVVTNLKKVGQNCNCI